MILFFDTETTGFVRDRLPFDHPDQPHLCQIALMLTSDIGAPIAHASLIVNPGVPIPTAASDVHGITAERAAALGVSENAAFGLFMHMADRADLIVAHNIKFDLSVMACVGSRSGREPPNPNLRPYCTMESARPIVQLPPTERMLAAGITDFKPPRLEECIQHFFGETLDGAHDALVDVAACARVFFHLKELEAKAA